MNTKIPLILLVLLLLLPLTVAQDAYQESGFEDGKYDQDDIGFFNSELSATSVNDNALARGLNDGEQTPLVGNMDNTGALEIVLIDNGVVRIYDRDFSAINILDSITIGTSSDQFSNPILFDIDGDGFLEYIFTHIQMKLELTATYDLQK